MTGCQWGQRPAASVCLHPPPFSGVDQVFRIPASWRMRDNLLQGWKFKVGLLNLWGMREDILVSWRTVSLDFVVFHTISITGEWTFYGKNIWWAQTVTSLFGAKVTSEKFCSGQLSHPGPGRHYLKNGVIGSVITGGWGQNNCE